MRSNNLNYIFPLIIIICLFFTWGFVTNLNDILIPHLKRACELNDFQSAFVQFAFFGAYFLMSIPAGILLKKTGYKMGIVIGLLICFCGALLFIPAANTRVYLYFLIALSLLASGITLLQVAANPYVSILGPAHKAASRISLVGTFNSIGASIAPLIGGFFILKEKDILPTQLNAMPVIEKLNYLNMEAASVKMPYIILAICLFTLAIVIFLSKLPEIENSNEIEISSENTKIYNHKNLIFGVIGIFLYVGAEVTIGSFIIRYGQYLELDGFTERIGAQYVFYYMISAMVGRILGIFYLPKVKSSNALIVKSTLAVLLIGLSILGKGYFALWCIVLVGFCNSIIWPAIFPLAISGLGNHTKRGSSLLIMGVVGGAIIPLIFGLLSDYTNTQIAFLIPGICYLFTIFYGFKGYKPLIRNV